MTRSNASAGMIFVLGATATVFACGDLKGAQPDVDVQPSTPGATVPGGPATPGADGAIDPRHPDDGGTGADGNASADAGRSPVDPFAGLGPAPRAGMPTGVCCAKDDECRFGRCVEFSEGNAMCTDTCATDGDCARGDELLGFTCHATYKICVPVPFFYCIKPWSFPLGTKASGACCTPAEGGTNGIECASGHCVSGSGAGAAGICSRSCKDTLDCPTGWGCEGAPQGRCVPLASPYACH